jgi:hypothetical protein
MKGEGMSENVFDRSVLSGEAGRLLDCLLNHVNETGRAQVSASDLLMESGLTQGALVRGRAELAHAGLLRIERGFSPSGLRGANVYVLNLTAIKPSSTHFQADEIGRMDADELDVPGHLVSGEVPAPSSGHRGERKGFWKGLFGRSASS